MKLSISARAFVALVIVSGLLVIAVAGPSVREISLPRMLAFLVVACLAARLKVKLPGMTSSMAVNLPFILIAAAQTGLAEALIVGCISNLVHCLPSNRKDFRFVQTSFNVCNMALAVWMTRLIYESPALSTVILSASLRLGIAAAVFFLVNTVPVSIVLTLTETGKLARTWLEIAQLSFPYFLASAGIAGVALTVSTSVGWQVVAAILVIMLAVFASYRRYFASLGGFFSDAVRRPIQSQPADSREIAKAQA